MVAYLIEKTVLFFFGHEDSAIKSKTKGGRPCTAVLGMMVKLS